MSGVLTARKSEAQACQLSEQQFSYVLQLIYQLTGIAMTAAKRQLVERRIASRMSALKVANFEDYAALLKLGDPTEVELFTNAVTTNLTAFFRENHHFEFLREQLLPQFVRHRHESGKRLRIWSAGCSTGEEAYSIAMTLREVIGDIESWDAKVLCTDIDSQVVDIAKRGVYAAERIEGMPEAQVRRWFQRGTGAMADKVRVKPALQKILTFQRLNLMQEWPFSGQFEVIFCRNVMIYFDKPTQERLVERFAHHLAPGGHLIVGHSESLVRNTTQFELLGRTIYRKVS
ncbi:MAG: protein-glutamate O-methyltransferase CheR [Pseudomonadota bacterium]